MENVKIIFANGYELEAELNGNCFICAERQIIPNDLTTVRVEGENTNLIFTDAIFQECASADGRYWFTFIETSTDERARKQIQEAIASLEDALCEQDAASEERLAAIEDALCELDKEEIE